MAKERVKHQSIAVLNNGLNKIGDEIRRRWNWIVRKLRKETNNNSREAMEWRLEGKRKAGRPRIKFRRTTETWRIIGGPVSNCECKRMSLKCKSVYQNKFGFHKKKSCLLAFFYSHAKFNLMCRQC